MINVINKKHVAVVVMMLLGNAAYGGNGKGNCNVQTVIPKQRAAKNKSIQTFAMEFQGRLKFTPDQTVHPALVTLVKDIFNTIISARHTVSAIDFANVLEQEVVPDVVQKACRDRRLSCYPKQIKPDWFSRCFSDVQAVWIKLTRQGDDSAQSLQALCVSLVTSFMDTHGIQIVQSSQEAEGDDT